MYGYFLTIMNTSFSCCCIIEHVAFSANFLGGRGVVGFFFFGIWTKKNPTTLTLFLKRKIFRPINK